MKTFSQILSARGQLQASVMVAHLSYKHRHCYKDLHRNEQDHFAIQMKLMLGQLIKANDILYQCQSHNYNDNLLEKVALQ